MPMPGMPNPAMHKGDSGVWIGKTKFDPGTGVETITYPSQQPSTYTTYQTERVPRTARLYQQRYGPYHMSRYLVVDGHQTYLDNHWGYFENKYGSGYGRPIPGKILILPEDLEKVVVSDTHSYYILKGSEIEFNGKNYHLVGSFQAPGIYYFYYREVGEDFDNGLLYAPNDFYSQYDVRHPGYEMVRVYWSLGGDPITEEVYNEGLAPEKVDYSVIRGERGEYLTDTDTGYMTVYDDYTNEKTVQLPQYPKVAGFQGDEAIRFYQDMARYADSNAERLAAQAWLDRYYGSSSQKSQYTQKTSDIRKKYANLKGKKAVEYYKEVVKYSKSATDRAAAAAWLTKHEGTPVITYDIRNAVTYDIRNEYTDLEGEGAVDYYKNVARNSQNAAERAAAEAWLAKHEGTPEYSAFKTLFQSDIRNEYTDLEGEGAVDYYKNVAQNSRSAAERAAATAWLAQHEGQPGYLPKSEQTPAPITLSTELGEDIIVTPTKNTSSEEWINILKAASELNGIDGIQGEEAVRFYELMEKYAPNYLGQAAAGSWLGKYAGTPGHPDYDEDAYENTAFEYKGIIYDSEALFDTGEFTPIAKSLMPSVKYRESYYPEEAQTKSEMIAAQEVIETAPVVESPDEQSWFDSYIQATPLYSLYQAGSWAADFLGFQDEYNRVGQVTYDLAKSTVSDAVANVEPAQVVDSGIQSLFSLFPGTRTPVTTISAIDEVRDLFSGETRKITISKSVIYEEEQKTQERAATVQTIGEQLESQEPEASRMSSELKTIYDKNVNENGEWVGSEADWQRYNQLYLEYKPTLENYDAQVEKYETALTQYETQLEHYNELSQQHTEEVNETLLFAGLHNLFSKNITPEVSKWATSATVDYLMVPAKAALDTPSNILYAAADLTGIESGKTSADLTKSVTDTIWHNDYNVSLYDFLYYGVRPAPEFLTTMVGSAPAALEYAYREPTDFASLFPAKLAEETIGTGTYAVEHPAAFFGMLAAPYAWKGVKALPREISKLSPGFDRTSVWTGRYKLTDAVRGKTTYSTWWEQYRQAQPSFRDAMTNSVIDPYLATDILTGKKSVTQALSDVWKAGKGPGLGEYISPNRWKTTHYTPKTSAKQMVELADTSTPRIEYSQFYDSKHPLGPKTAETRRTSFGDHAAENVFVESAAIEGKLLVNSGKSSLLESGLFLGVEKTLAPFLEHAYPAVMRVKAPVWEYSQKVRDLVKKAEEYDYDISLLEKKLKKKGLSDSEALKLVELTAERAKVEKTLQKQVDLEFADAPENVLIPGPKPTSRRAYHGELQEEFILKDGSELFRSENWRTQLYDRFGLTRGTKYGYDPKSLQKYEIMEFTTEKPKSGTPGQKPSVWFDIPGFQKNLFYTPAYRSLVYGVRGVKSAIESPVRQFREARAEREILSKIDDPETKAAAKATIDTIRDIRGMKSAINLDIDLAALKEVGPELAGPLSELFQKHRVVMYGSGVNLATIPKERLWRELKDADLFIPREEAASFLVDAKKMFKKLGWDVKQDGLQVLSKEGRHLLDIHEAPVDYPLIGGTAMRRDPYTIEDQTPIAADYMPTRLETGEVFVRESLVTQASRKLNSMLDQFYEGKFKPNRAKDYPDGILSVEELLDFAEGKIDPNFFKAGYEKAKTITEQSRWEKLADLYSEVKRTTLDKTTKAKIQRIRENLEIIKNHSYVKPLYEAALKKGALYRLENFEQLLREVNEAEFGMGIIRERGGYLDLETGLSRLSKIGDEGEAAVTFSFDEAGIKPSETGSILDYHTHPLTGIMKYDRYDIFSIQDLKSFLYTDVKQGSVVTGGETYLFTKGPKTQAKIDRIINNKFDPFTGENIRDLSPAEKLSKYIDGLTDNLRRKQTRAMYEEALKAEPKLTKKQFLSRVNSNQGRYAHYIAILYNRVVKDIAKDLGCKVEEGGFSQAMSRTNLIWDDSTPSIAEIEMGSERMAPTVSDMGSSPRALINVGYAPYPSRGAGKGTGISPAIAGLMQASVFGGNYMQQTPELFTGETVGKITYDVGKPAKSPDSRSAAREIQDVMTSTIDLAKPLTRYDTGPKIAKSWKPTKSSPAPKQQQTAPSPSLYPARTTPISRRPSATPYPSGQSRPSSPRLVVDYSYSHHRGGRDDLSYVFGDYNYDYPNRGYKYGDSSVPYGYEGYGYDYDYPSTKTSIPDIPIITVITGSDDRYLWKRNKDESDQQDRRHLKKYHKYTEITGGATPGQAMNIILGNSTVFSQMIGAQGADEGKLTVDKKTKSRKKPRSTKTSKKQRSNKTNKISTGTVHPILFETLI